MATMPRFDPFQVLASADLDTMAAEIERTTAAVFSGLTQTARPAVRVKRTTEQVIPSLDFTELIWEAADVDTSGMWNPDTPDLLTVTVPGVWVLSGQIRYDPAPNGFRWDQINANNRTSGFNGGVSLAVNIIPTRNDGYGNAVPVLWVGRLVQGDVLYNYAYQESGADLALPTSAGGCYLSGFWIGP